jgi:hypothetical protein
LIEFAVQMTLIEQQVDFVCFSNDFDLAANDFVYFANHFIFIKLI